MLQSKKTHRLTSERRSEKTLACDNIPIELLKQSKAVIDVVIHLYDNRCGQLENGLKTELVQC